MMNVITALPIGIALAGLALFVVLVVGIRQAADTVKLHRHRSREAGMADLLTYASVVEDGIVVCKSGALMATWIYAGDDHAGTTDEEKERVSAMINAALSELGDGFMLHVDAVRRAVPSYIGRGLSHFPDPVSAAIDEERRLFFEKQDTMYEGFYVLTLTWYPPMLAQARFVDLMFDDDTTPTTPTGRFEKLLEQFKKDMDTLENRLSSVLRMERLQGRSCVREDGTTAVYDDFLSFLQFCVTGITQPMILPRTPVHLDAVLGGQELYGGVIPKIGQNFVQVVAIDGFPLESSPGMLSALTDMDVEYRWSSRFIFLDDHAAIAHMNAFRKKWRQKQRGIIDAIFHTNSAPDADALAMTFDAETAMAEVQSGLTAAGYYTSVVVLMDADRDRLELAAQKLQKAIFNLGFAARVETVNTMDAWLGSLPGHGVENVRRPIINTMNLADLLPVSTIWTGEDRAPCPLYPPDSPALMYGVAAGHSPFRVNLHVRDVGHTIMFGPTGAGKSTALATLVAQFRRYKDMKIFAFDKGLSIYALTRACGGNHFTINGDDTHLQFCPLHYLQTSADRAWAKDWLDTILALNDVHSTVEQRQEITRVLESMAETGECTLTYFANAVGDSSIRACLQEGYTMGGTIGALLDAEEDGLAFSDFTCFELEELMRLREKHVLPVLLYLFRRIERALDGSPAIIVLDEAWLMLGHPVFAAKVAEWLRVLRKANCAVIMATQNVADAASSVIWPIIVENTATKIFLPNPHARNEDTAIIYTRMGLNRQQIEIIAQAVPKRDYYLISDRGSRLFSLALGKLALAFVAVSDKDSVAHIRQLETAHGHEWVQHWLVARNLALIDYQSLQNNREAA